MSRMFFRFLFAAFLAAAAVSCAPTGSVHKDAGVDGGLDIQDGDVNTSGDADVVQGPRVEELGVYEHAYEGKTYLFSLLRIERTDGGNAYVMHAPLPDAAPYPVVVLARPYDGIDWTEEPVDAKWAQRYQNEPGATYPDDDEPNYVQGTSSNIAYRLWTIQELAAETNYWLMHGISPVLVFGRFYAGENVAATARVMQAALLYLTTRPDVDAARVGITGGSWGGFMTLYGAALSPPEIRPAAAGLAGPVDFPAMVTYVREEIPVLVPPANLPVFSAFFEPYIRRIEAARGQFGGGPDSWNGLQSFDVCIGLQGDTLVLHDDWDTLVPFSQSAGLASSCSRVDALFWTHDDPLDWSSAGLSHGPASEETPVATMISLGYGYLLARLAPPGKVRYFAWTRSHMKRYLERIRELESRGATVRGTFARLREWLSPSSFVVDFGTDPASIAPADEALASLLSEVWETPIAPASVDAWLSSR